jgi:pyridoxal phosphate enzyme (YggS family)
LNEIQTRYLDIKKQIESVCLKNQIDPSTVQLLAVSKKQPIEKIKFVFELGQKYFGENYVQEALEKQKSLIPIPISWHFIGHLQRNKVKDVVGQFEMIHSVDSMDLAIKISQKAEEKGLSQKILLELNLAQEKSKGGMSKEELELQFQKMIQLPSIILSGLMVLPPPAIDPELVRPYFREAKIFFNKFLNQMTTKQKESWKFLSMGTTQDYLVAIQEGANIVRLGTAIFGERE